MGLWMPAFGGMQQGDRRDSNPRPSEPRSVRAFLRTSCCVQLCGLGKPKNPASVGLHFLMCPGMFCPLLLPLLL